MRISDIKKNISLCEDTYDLLYKGKAMKKVGEGGYRSVFKIPKQNLVVKLEYDDSDRQSYQEWELYKKLKCSPIAGMLVKGYAPFCKQRHTMSIHEYVHGKTIFESSDKVKRDTNWFEVAQDLEEKYKLCDLHDENFMYCTKTKSLKIVDLGRGV